MATVVGNFTETSDYLILEKLVKRDLCVLFKCNQASVYAKGALLSAVCLSDGVLELQACIAQTDAVRRLMVGTHNCTCAQHH